MRPISGKKWVPFPYSCRFLTHRVDWSPLLPLGGT